jgi:hypothetical protein
MAVSGPIADTRRAAGLVLNVLVTVVPGVGRDRQATTHLETFAGYACLLWFLRNYPYCLIVTRRLVYRIRSRIKKFKILAVTA